MNPTLPTPLLPSVCAPESPLTREHPTLAGPAGSLPAAVSNGRTGFEHIRKPVALLCIAAWVYAALKLPARHGGAAEWSAWAGHLLVAFGAFGRIWCTLYIGGHKNGRLCRYGPYARTRNPLYFFSWVGVTGIALIFRQPWLVPLAWLGFFITFAPLVHIEEGRLARMFGADYERYRREVPRFFPGRAHVTERVGSEQAPGKLAQIEGALADALWFLMAAALIETLVSGGGWEHLAAWVR